MKSSTDALTIQDVALRLGCNASVVFSLIENGELPASLVDRVYRITQDDLAYYLEFTKYNEPDTPDGKMTINQVTGAKSLPASPSFDQDAIIVTRHMGAVQWLAQKGIRGRHMERVKRAEVRGKTIYGVVPLPMAALAKEVYIIEMPKMDQDQTRSEMTPDEMDKAGAVLVRYRVERFP